MNLSWKKWLTPILLRLLLSLTTASQIGLAGASSAADARSVHLVASFSLALASDAPAAPAILSIPSPPAAAAPELELQPRRSSSLDGTTTTVTPLTTYELSLPIMPLHLLPKKSWNVYNTANIERVRRDEAAAAAEAAAEEERMQEEDAKRRMAILRGEDVPPPLALPAPEEGTSSPQLKRGREEGNYDEKLIKPEKKRPRKRWNENETDFEMRVARDEISRKADGDSSSAFRDLTSNNAFKKKNDDSITDAQGHISLFPTPLDPQSSNRKPRNADAEREAAQKKKEIEDQYTMRFSNAAGFKEDIRAQPWYLGAGGEGRVSRIESADRPEPSERERGGPGHAYEKEGDRWGKPASRYNGNERNQKTKFFTSVTDDPLAIMKRGAAKVRQVERERRSWLESREKEMKSIDREERRKRRDHVDDDDDLEGFSLDASGRKHRVRGVEQHGDRDRRHRHHHRHDHSRHREHNHSSGSRLRDR